MPAIHLIDDDPSFNRAVARLLTVAGFGVKKFTSAAGFLAQHRDESRGCVLVDLRMPEMSGIELQAALAKTPNPLPVIFLTGHGDIPTSVQAIKSGAEDFLTKPVQKEPLLAAVQRALVRDEKMVARRERQRDLRQRFASLTPREAEVLVHVIAGKLNKETAGALDTTERTIKAHRASIMEKMQAGSPAELGRMAQELGLRAAAAAAE